MFWCGFLIFFCAFLFLGSLLKIHTKTNKLAPLPPEPFQATYHQHVPHLDKNKGLFYITLSILGICGRGNTFFVF